MFSAINMSRSARCGSDSFKSAMNCSLGNRGPAAGEKLLDLGEHQIAVLENLVVVSHRWSAVLTPGAGVYWTAFQVNVACELAPW